MLKPTKVYLALTLVLIFQQSLETTRIPDDWKLSHVVRIFETGNISELAKNRPISLKYITCKLFLHVLFPQINKDVGETRIIFSNQYGFKWRRCYETQLFELTTEIYTNLHELMETNVVFIDFENAFDRVGQMHLIHKMRTCQIDTQVIDWVQEHLRDRHQAVLIVSVVSDFRAVMSCVPQCSVLAPTLFFIFINHIGKVVNSRIRPFADDCVVFVLLSAKIIVKN